MEVWKDIVGYEGLYKVSNLGNVMSLEKYIDNKRGAIQYRPPKVLKQYKNKFGYMRVYLTRNSIKKMYAVHRLVASAFIDNPNNKPCVNHIDNNRENNHLTNLEKKTVNGQKYKVDENSQKNGNKKYLIQERKNL